MTVSELIQALSQKEPGAKVKVYQDEYEYPFEVIDVATHEDKATKSLFVELVQEH